MDHLWCGTPLLLHFFQMYIWRYNTQKSNITAESCRIRIEVYLCDQLKGMSGCNECVFRDISPPPSIVYACNVHQIKKIIIVMHSRTSLTMESIHNLSIMCLGKQMVQDWITQTFKTSMTLALPINRFGISSPSCRSLYVSMTAVFWCSKLPRDILVMTHY